MCSHPRRHCVCPGFVATDMWTAVAHQQSALLSQSPEEFTRRQAQRIPLGRMERAEDVANVIRFLVSPRSDYMTGQALSVVGALLCTAEYRLVVQNAALSSYT